MINEITAADFAQHVTGDAVVKVTAPWCGACKAVHPGYSKLSDEMTDIKFFEINADSNTDFVMNLQVKSLPSFLFFKNGLLVSRTIGNNLPGIITELKKLVNTN